jgi:DNA-binding NarL/FixJ family response regulator
MGSGDVMSGLKILLVDDHALFRSGLRFLLADLDQEIAFVEAESCVTALATATEDIDLVLLDFHLPDSDGNFEALIKIKAQLPSSTVVVLSSEDDPSIIRGAVDAGAAGFIPKSSTPDIMIAALKLILAGGIYLPPAAYALAPVKKIEVREPKQDSQTLSLDQNLVSQLSDRQLEVLMGAIKGKPNKIIARELNIAEGTVKAHLSVAFKVMDVKNRTEAVFMAAKLGLGV